MAVAFAQKERVSPLLSMLEHSAFSFPSLCKGANQGCCGDAEVSLSYIQATCLSSTEKETHYDRIIVSLQCSCSLLGCSAQYLSRG